MVDVNSPTTGVLAITERFHEGWSAKVDGRVVPATKVASDFVGVPVEPGRHRVELTFAPASLRWGAALSAVGLLGLVAGIYTTARLDAGKLRLDAVKC